MQATSSFSAAMKKLDLSILFGNAFDHYDIAIYSFLAPVLGPVFFPGHDALVQLILAYSVLATAVFAQPLGAFLFGNLASTLGPNVALSYSLVGVAVTTLMIGILPGHDAWGWFAPFSLVLIRVIRGVCAAGETTIAKLYILEGKSDAQGLKASYLYQSSTMVGIVLASGLSTLVVAFYPEGWRACFILGSMTGFAAYCLRRNAFTTASTGATKESLFERYSTSALKLLWTHRLSVLRVALVDIFGHVTYVVPFVFMNSFVPLITAISLETMMAINTALLLLDVILIPVLGPIVARFDPIKVMCVASSILTVTLIPLFQLMVGASLGFIIFVRIWVLFWGVVFLCPLNFWCKNLFDTPEKYFLVGMGSAIGAGTLGRTLTPIFFWLWYSTELPIMPAVYMSAITLVTAVAVYTSRKKERMLPNFNVRNLAIEKG